MLTVNEFHLSGVFLSNAITGSPDSQQPTGSQIIRICMGIYRKIDKTVKMYVNSYRSVLVHYS